MGLFLALAAVGTGGIGVTILIYLVEQNKRRAFALSRGQFARLRQKLNCGFCADFGPISRLYRRGGG